MAVRISVGAAMPSLPWISAGLLVGGVRVLAAGIALIADPARRAAGHHRGPTEDGYLLQSCAAKRAEAFAREERLRQEHLSARTAFAAALTELK